MPDFRQIQEARRLRRQTRRNQATQAKQPVEVATPPQRGGLAITPGGLPLQPRRGPIAVRQEPESNFGQKVGLKFGQDVAKQAFKALTPGQAPSHGVSPESRAAMQEQRAGERAEAPRRGLTDADFRALGLSDYRMPGEALNAEIRAGLVPPSDLFRRIGADVDKES